MWEPLHTHLALGLLGKDFDHPVVRSYAVSRLEQVRPSPTMAFAGQPIALALSLCLSLALSLVQPLALSLFFPKQHHCNLSPPLPPSPPCTTNETRIRTQQADDEELTLYLLQLVQALRYERQSLSRSLHQDRAQHSLFSAFSSIAYPRARACVFVRVCVRVCVSCFAVN